MPSPGSSLGLGLPVKSLVKLTHSHFAGKNVNHNNPAIINMHGLFGSRMHFKQLNKNLAKEMETDVFVVDLRNHGSSPVAKPYDYLTMSEDIVHFVHNHIEKERPVHLMGFSLGGKIALLTALSSSLKSSSCISVDIPPYATPKLDDILLNNYSVIMKIVRGESGYIIKKNDPRWKEKVLKLFKSLDVNTNEGIALYFSRGFVMNPANDSTSDKLLEFALPLEKMPDLLEYVKAWPSEEELKQRSYNCSTETPTLFCKALKSHFILPDYSLLGRQYPNYEVVEFNTSHNVIAEATDEFYRTIVNFMKKHHH